MKHDPNSPLRVYVTGSHSAGKTTLARWISGTYCLPLVNEVCRSVLAERELDLSTIRHDLTACTRYQAEVFGRQADAEDAAGGSFVSDRSFDALAYTARHTLSVSLFMGDAAEYAMSRLRAPGSIVLLLRPRRELMVQDGTRESLVWDEMVAVDATIRFLYEMHDVDYISVSSDSMAVRARTVRAVLKAAGVIPVMEGAHSPAATPHTRIKAPVRGHRTPKTGATQ